MTQPKSILPAWLGVLSVLTLGLLGWGMYEALVASPPDINQGELIRIMYAHVSVAWICFLAVFMCAVFSCIYLWRGKPSSDLFAVASAEMALFYAGLTILGGMTYSKPTLGVWWTWDPKLTLTALMFTLLIGYFIVRGLIDDPQQRGRISAVISIIILTGLPLNWFAAVWWRTAHPAKSFAVNAEGVNDTMDPIMRNTLLLHVGIAALIFVLFMLVRVRIGRLELAQTRQDQPLTPSSSSEVIHV